MFFLNLKKSFMTEPQIRKMTVQDAIAISDIEHKLVYDPWSARLFADCVAVGYECWVFEHDDQVIGFGILNITGDEAHLMNIAIEPSRHREGLGSRLLSKLIHIARDANVKEIILEVRDDNFAAQKMYEKFNFERIGIRKNYYKVANGNQDAWTYSLDLANNSS